jgi:hypothetical protein
MPAARKATRVVPEARHVKGASLPLSYRASAPLLRRRLSLENGVRRDHENLLHQGMLALTRREARGDALHRLMRRKSCPTHELGASTSPSPTDAHRRDRLITQKLHDRIRLSFTAFHRTLRQARTLTRSGLVNARLGKDLLSCVRHAEEFRAGCFMWPATTPAATCVTGSVRSILRSARCATSVHACFKRRCCRRLVIAGSTQLRMICRHCLRQRCDNAFPAREPGA